MRNPKIKVPDLDFLGFFSRIRNDEFFSKCTHFATSPIKNNDLIPRPVGIAVETGFRAHRNPILLTDSDGERGNRYFQCEMLPNMYILKKISSLKIRQFTQAIKIKLHGKKMD